MKRLHLFEFLDQPWLPGPIRAGMVDYLATISRVAGIADKMVPEVQRLVDAAHTDAIVDLCSGSGGPLPVIAPKLRERVQVTLTDQHPVAIPLPDGFSYHPDPVDATACDVPGARTLFEGLHHFPPDAARAILADALHKRAPIGVFEVTSRSVASILSAPLIPLFVVLLVPLIRPFRLWTWVLTYLVPVLPAAILWDGFVSHLRTYTPDELRQMTADLQAPDYAWEIGTTSVGPGAKITWLRGFPTG